MLCGYLVWARPRGTCRVATLGFPPTLTRVLFCCFTDLDYLEGRAVHRRNRAFFRGASHGDGGGGRVLRHVQADAGEAPIYVEPMKSPLNLLRAPMQPD